MTQKQFKVITFFKNISYLCEFVIKLLWLNLNIIDIPYIWSDLFMISVPTFYYMVMTKEIYKILRIILNYGRVII